MLYDPAEDTLYPTPFTKGSTGVRLSRLLFFPPSPPVLSAAVRDGTKICGRHTAEICALARSLLALSPLHRVGRLQASENI